MQSAAQLQELLRSINRKSYPAYKSTKGTYQFKNYILSIDHVQGDPFASPSHVSIRIRHTDSRIPAEYYQNTLTKITLADFLTRQFERQVSQYTFRAKGSGKSGLILVTHCGQEVLSRTACQITDQEIVEISLIENIQREDLNPIEEAMAYKRLMEEFHLKQDEIADRVAKSRTAVTNSMRLLKLTSKVQEMVIADMISAGHARALLGISDETLQENTAMKVFDEKLSVRETEKLVKNLVSPTKKEKTERNTAEDAIYESLEEKMKGIMGTKVSIQRKKNNKGKIEIEYYSRDELERIIDLFESIR